MKSKILNIIIIVLFVCGIAVFLYPSAVNWLSNQESRQSIAEFDRFIQDDGNNQGEPTKTGHDMEQFFADMQAYNTSIYENGQAGLKDPFSYETPAFDLSRYGFEENMIGYISLPRLNNELPIYLGASTENMAKGVANLGNTSLPIGGVNTNAVLAAHRGYNGKAMFRNIESLEIGDRIYITNFFETLAYRVSEIKIIMPSDIEEIHIQPDRDLITLLTCHPYTQNYQRYIVLCERTETEPADSDATVNTGLEFRNIFNFRELSLSRQMIFIEHWVPIIIAAIMIFIISLRLVFFIVKRLKK